jgi:D-alanyl-D-alanine carboxypeptidase (penicillin-binding protein 5/6)
MVYMKLILILLLSFCSSIAYANLNIYIQSPSAILINAETGKILYEKKAHKPLFPASITKIATALYALQRGPLKLDKMIKADQDSIGAISSKAKEKSGYQKPAYWLEFGGTHMGIKRGEVLSLKDLFFGMMVISANDAANLIAKEISGSVPDFVTELNAYLKTLGCENTYFMNPHGLHHPDHVTSAYDMALITQEAMKYPFFQEIASTVSYKRPKTNKQEPAMMAQSNRLIRSGKYYYEPTILGKTGYHSLARHTLVAVAERNGRKLIAVVMNAPKAKDKYKDIKTLFEAAFQEQKMEMELVQSGPIEIQRDIDSASPSILKVYIKKPCILEYYPSEKPTVDVNVNWVPLDLPIRKNQNVGTLSFIIDKTKQVDVPLFSQVEIKATLWARLPAFIKEANPWTYFGALGLLLTLFLRSFLKKVRAY